MFLIRILVSYGVDDEKKIFSRLLKIIWSAINKCDSELWLILPKNISPNFINLKIYSLYWLKSLSTLILSFDVGINSDDSITLWLFSIKFKAY